MTLPIITDVTRYEQKDGLTTIFFQCKMFDGRGTLTRTWEINDYELNWYYKQLGWDQRYSPFNDFWGCSTEQEKLDFLFIFLTDEKAWLSAGAKAKVRDEVREFKTVQIRAFKWAS